MQKFHDVEYFKTLTHILNNGVIKGDRTGTGTISSFGNQMKFDLSDMSIPLLTTKKMNLNSIIHELIWFISGNTNVKYLNDNGVKIWNLWADKNGDLGPTYGAQWRKVKKYNALNKNDSIDQLQNAIDLIKDDPNSRRIIVDSWNVPALDQMELPPCHFVFQFWVNLYDQATLDSKKLSIQPQGELKLHFNMRSNDFFLGNPFNIVQYAILAHMIAQITGLEATELIYSGSDTHIYLNHLDQVEEQLSRDPHKYESPTLKLNPLISHIDDYKFNDIEILNYMHYPQIKGKVSK